MSLLENTDKIHTTQMGVGRIKRNLKLDTDDVVGYCISKIKDKNSKISRKGKNSVSYTHLTLPTKLEV